MVEGCTRSACNIIPNRLLLVTSYKILVHLSEILVSDK